MARGGPYRLELSGENHLEAAVRNVSGLIGRAGALAICIAALVGCGDNGPTPPTPNFDISTQTATVAEGQTVTFTVALTEATTIDAAVQLSVADTTAATISPAVVT